MGLGLPRRRPSRFHSSPDPRNSPPRARWWQGWGFKAAAASAAASLIVGTLWTQGSDWVRSAWRGSQTSASTSPTPTATPPGDGGSTPSDGPSSPNPDPTADRTSEPTGRPTDWHPPTPTRTPKPSPPPPSPTVIPAAVRRSGTLVMADYTGYDLDSLAANWRATKDGWDGHDIAYASWWEDVQNNALVSHDYMKYATSLPGSGPWERRDCAGAAYGDSAIRPVGDLLLPDRGICVVTTEGRYALLVVTGSAKGQLTVDVIVWK